MGIKTVFRHMDKDESKLIMLKKENELIKGYLHRVVGSIDLDNPNITLIATLERGEKGSVSIYSFLGACQKWHENFKDKGVLII